MTLMRYEPWSLMNQLQKEVNRLFDNRLTGEQRGDDSVIETSQWVPAVDIKEESNGFVLLADLPGVDPDTIEILMRGNVLTIKGEKKHEKREEKESFTRVERVQGRFLRVFTLPEAADGDQIKASSNHGVLRIEIPKKEQAKPRAIKVEIDKRKN